MNLANYFFSEEVIILGWTTVYVISYQYAYVCACAYTMIVAVCHACVHVRAIVLSRPIIFNHWLLPTSKCALKKYMYCMHACAGWVQLFGNDLSMRDTGFFHAWLSAWYTTSGSAVSMGLFSWWITDFYTCDHVLPEKNNCILVSSTYYSLFLCYCWDKCDFILLVRVHQW